MKRERLGSRLGFIMLSAGCAIGCGNVWKFPWMCGQNGGGSFMLVYILCLIVLGIPCLIMEFSVGRASQTSPINMYKKLEKPKQKWGGFGWVCLVGNISLMAFYTVVCGWLINYFVKFVSGNNQNMGFDKMTADPSVNVLFLLVTVVVSFFILSFNLQGGLERVTKYMMIALLVLMVVLAVNSLMLGGAGEGMNFYLKPDFSKINGSVVVGAMNQAFFTLSLGIAAMEIFGSYMSKDHTLPRESIKICALDTFVAIMSGVIIFPACMSYNIPTDSGPSLIFVTLPKVFEHMSGGRFWGAMFFLFMTFAALSTVIAVLENIIACNMEAFGWNRKKAGVINLFIIIIMSIPCILGFNVLSGFTPLGAGTNVLDLEDFLVSSLILPIGSLVILLFCTTKLGWGYDNYMNEVNTGKGIGMPKIFKFYLKYILPLVILFIIIDGLI